jgi:tRNA(Ile)-lysidine synthase
MSAPPDHGLGGLVATLLPHCTFASIDRPGPEGVICGVSGGADSLALLVLAAAWFGPRRVTAFHLDHGWRPDAAPAEADVVAAAAALLDTGFRSERLDVEPGSNLEARSRIARHRVLGPDALLGHTADDQAETLLINLARGAGPTGLGGIRPGPRHPILTLRRTETVRVCALAGFEPVQDPSNHDPRFVRTRMRNELLPLLADIADRDPVPLLNRTADLSREAADEITRRADELDPTDTRALRRAPRAVVSAALRDWLRTPDGHPPSAGEVERVLAVVENRVKACELAGGRRVSRSDGRLILHPNAPEA